MCIVYLVLYCSLKVRNLNNFDWVTQKWLLGLSPGPFGCTEALAPLAGQALNPGKGGTSHVHSHLAHAGQLPQHQAVICCVTLFDLKHRNVPFSALPLPSIAKMITQGTAAVQTGYETFSGITPENWCAKFKTGLWWWWGKERQEEETWSSYSLDKWEGGETWSSSEE